MAPPRWIHCSLCYSVMANGESKFYHLSCRHILCRACMAKTGRGTVCPVCKNPLKRFVELNNQMERRDKMWYDPAATKIFDLASQTLTFQQKHREHLIQRLVQARTALPRLNDLEAQLRQHVVETQRRYEKLRAFRRNLQENLRRSLQPTLKPTQPGRCAPTPTPSLSIRPSGLLRTPHRRLSTESVFSLMHSQRAAAPMQALNESGSLQPFGSSKLSHKRLSNDSGFGGNTPGSGSLFGSARRTNVNTSANMLNRTRFTNPRN